VSGRAISSQHVERRIAPSCGRGIGAVRSPHEAADRHFIAAIYGIFNLLLTLLGLAALGIRLMSSAG
jgi:hypothetical protein